jgi:hypothetical protein
MENDRFFVGSATRLINGTDQEGNSKTLGIKTSLNINKSTCSASAFVV